MRRTLILVAATLLAATLVPYTASAKPVPKATGSIAMSNPLQYLSFDAFDYGAAANDRGTATYTNFNLPTAGTGVWDVRGTYPLVFSANGTDYPFTLTINSITPTSPSAYSFSGSGVYDADASYTFTITGTVNGTAVVYDIVYTGTAAGHTIHGSGQIAPDGSISGSATDVNSLALTFESPAGSAHEVLSFTGNVTCAQQVSTTTFNFVFSVPAATGLPFAGVLATVTDGGSPGAGHDTYGHTSTNNLSSCATASGTTSYPITSGNLVVHKS